MSWKRLKNQLYRHTKVIFFLIYQFLQEESPGLGSSWMRVLLHSDLNSLVIFVHLSKDFFRRSPRRTCRLPLHFHPTLRSPCCCMAWTQEWTPRLLWGVCGGISGCFRRVPQSTTCSTWQILPPFRWMHLAVHCIRGIKNKLQHFNLRVAVGTQKTQCFWWMEF